ncbi:unnamed protein product [Zymoseptoria tritici ST99CH_1A5]|uniref:Uncharacterized protein n=3 Tax=Zymoseptoria tritici TaxID=1047171 RepID=A0A1X7RGV3_ZYMT9|nr:unnamed protein product [Zymoseptoria tritici ST99CH_3D7]SMR42808.1 unnamed protein product [Zymoseptoria tritici ST99CH_1E4]SMR44980.1 unnamed protein product [Zymoseptoria tritici ST99CH_3D1]SMY20144.1 unnamed protein product [Zymoseptoria tritici ST99CH_1A5]
MGIVRTALAVTGWTTLGSTAGFLLWTRKSHIVDVPPTDYIFNHTLYSRYNPNNAPVTQDLCVRRVPLANIRPELLEKEGKLVEAFSAGLWGGLGYAYQRRFLEKKYRADPVTADHLWDKEQLRASTYEVGTKITDHFEVVAKSPESIIVRCGDSPRNKDVRESDGLFEMQAEIKKDEGVAEFGLKSVFYNGLAQPDKEGKPPAPPMSAWIQWLHAQYDKVLMETAISNCTR